MEFFSHGGIVEVLFKNQLTTVRYPTPTYVILQQRDTWKTRFFRKFGRMFFVYILSTEFFSIEVGVYG
jgi:hypothetical protein